MIIWKKVLSANKTTIFKSFESIEDLRKLKQTNPELFI